MNKKMWIMPSRSIEGLYKKFTKSLKRSMMYGTVDMMRGMVGAHLREELRKGEFWVLQNIVKKSL